MDRRTGHTSSGSDKLYPNISVHNSCMGSLWKYYEECSLEYPIGLCCLYLSHHSVLYPSNFLYPERFRAFGELGPKLRAARGWADSAPVLRERETSATPTHPLEKNDHSHHMSNATEMIIAIIPASKLPGCVAQ